MTEVVEKEPTIIISEDFGISFDKYNTILMQKYEKSDGKGKHAPKTGVIGWKDAGYFSTWKGVVEYLERNSLMNMKELSTLTDTIDRIAELKKEIAEVLAKNVKVIK